MAHGLMGGNKSIAVGGSTQSVSSTAETGYYCSYFVLEISDDKYWQLNSNK